MKRIFLFIYAVPCALSACLLPPKASGPALPLTSPDPANPHNLLGNATFEGGSSLPWSSSFTSPGSGETSVTDGAYCLKVTHQGVNPWDAQVRHRDMVIMRGHTYRLSFSAWASQPTTIRPKVGMAGPPYAEYWNQTIKLETSPRTFTASFGMQGRDDPSAELTFHMGGPLATATAPFSVCIDNVVLADPEFARAVRETKTEPVGPLFVNQVGYLPNLVKIAVLRSPAKDPLPWQLLDAANQAVASGSTAVFGQDPASGDHLHIIDFSSFSAPGKSYRLAAENHTSHPFDIDPRLYFRLKYDALAYFYHNRSGVPIEMPYAGGAQWTRPAGHAGDAKVACAPGSGCNYTLDVSGGWYDAGDHGKYVVGGGITLWTMFNQYERAKYFGSSSGDFADGKMAIPEKADRIADILDEARFEMLFMLKMQVPAGQPLAFMAHHKIHDQSWSELGTAPHEDKIVRYLQPPTTAATLNLAATAAQCARIYREPDPSLSARCLKAAEAAWGAALAHPNLFAPAAAVGGGPYNDPHVDDEFYWAAAELYITTGKAAYRDYLVKSTYFKRVPVELGDEAADRGSHTSMTWQNTEALGTLSLAVVPNQLEPAELALLKQNVVASADQLAGLIEREGYRVPFAPGPNLSYPWGSNSFVLNNLLVIGIAYDLSKDLKYLNAVVLGMDYLLGRNPLDKSYVAGYGERPLQNPHHRFWAHQLKAERPGPPPGAVSGGPNTGLQDPYVQAAGLNGCAPQKCYVDHIEAWSVNEVAINWNAPLAWVAAFLDEHAK
jgi:endoglucanase